MKKIAVIGLGIIGGSICKALTKAGYFVDGSDLDKETLACALEEGMIRGEATNLAEYDTVFLAVPPRAAISLLDAGEFAAEALVADICGVKSAVERAVYARPRPYRYVGLHPMAGRETSGIAYSSADLFSGANLVVTVAPGTESGALEEISEYAAAMRFKRITKCTAEEHDRKIALTSQLAHILSNAYVKSAEAEKCKGFTGGSFQDMTRIAGVDEDMWSQLYMLNRANVLTELDGLIERLGAYRDALASDDEARLKEELRAGRLLRERIKKEKY